LLRYQSWSEQEQLIRERLKLLPALHVSRGEADRPPRE
jgi:hypothetical protein